MLKAYRELDQEGLAEGRRGQGTFISAAQAQLEPDRVDALRSSLQRWVQSARAAGLDEDTMDALFAATVRPPASARVA